MSAAALSQFRKRLNELLRFYNRADAGMDLIDALSCAQGERSVVEWSLQPAFRSRRYSGLFKAISHFPFTPKQMMPLFACHLPLPQGRPFRCWPWAVFLDARRVATDQPAAQVARKQVSHWLQAQAQAGPPCSPTRPWSGGAGENPCRGLGRIIGRMGSPARRLQPRGKPVRREKGKRLLARPQGEIVRKGASKGRRTALRPN